MKATPYRFKDGAELSHKTRTTLPAEATIKPLRDVIIVEPLDGNLSAILIVINECKPIRGIVRAVGPGVYPKRYDHPEKNKRTKTWDSRAFRKTEVKVGDIVNLGGLDIGGYAFDTFYHGPTLMLIAREEDIAGIEVDPDADWIDAAGNIHDGRCGLNPDPDAMKHMVSYCTCPHRHVAA